MWDPRATGTSLTDDSISSGRGHAPGAWVHRLIVIVTGVALSAKYGAGQSTILTLTPTLTPPLPLPVPLPEPEA